MAYEAEAAAAREVAGEAGALLIRFAETPPSPMEKQDRSPVTEADRQSERLIRNRLAATFPDDAFLGEESGSAAGKSGRRWIVDPLDGTRPFLRGIPTYSVLIALEEDGIPVTGVIHLPAMNMTCWATRGGGAFLDGQPIRVSATANLSSALGTALGYVEHAFTPEGKRLLEFMRTWDYAYGFMDAYSYVLLASGRLDIAVNLMDKAWDCAAAACIVTEAGGRFSDIEGNETVHSGNIILSNGQLHDAALDCFRSISGN